MPLTWLIALLAKKGPIPITPFNITLLMISVQVLISLYATYDIAISLQKVTGVVWGITVFITLVRLSKNLKGILITSLVYLVGGSGILVLGLLGIDWPTNKIIIFNSLYESLHSLSFIFAGLKYGFHPNEVGGVTTWILPFLVTVSFGYY